MLLTIIRVISFLLYRVVDILRGGCIENIIPFLDTTLNGIWNVNEREEN